MGMTAQRSSGQRHALSRLYGLPSPHHVTTFYFDAHVELSRNVISADRRGNAPTLRIFTRNKLATITLNPYS
ncbi:MAG: hypothetical protein ACP5G4_07130, partial [bacterium]